ncbi:hypothetical protein S40285_10372 [Stachybotrys chlorohalonatus IBT 40285]|uniref:Uncharacterized protein n=1 Tax=Stachybotrys chlorohalonatus (strain IBT 40285) TaxID=1283841 RepID=A0A084QK20_STAC4|nr:hypothetical protein S40285_10372 [Stachybotrys chlorohalonata IBT 40285]
MAALPPTSTARLPLEHGHWDYTKFDFADLDKRVTAVIVSTQIIQDEDGGFINKSAIIMHVIPRSFLKIAIDPISHGEVREARYTITSHHELEDYLPFFMDTEHGSEPRVREMWTEAISRALHRYYVRSPDPHDFRDWIQRALASWNEAVYFAQSENTDYAAKLRKCYYFDSGGNLRNQERPLVKGWYATQDQCPLRLGLAKYLVPDAR